MATVRHYFRTAAGHCVSKSLATTFGSVVAEGSESFDLQGISGTIPAQNWGFVLDIDTPPSDTFTVQISLRRRNSGCAFQEQFGSSNNNFSGPGQHSVTVSASEVTFGVGDVLEISITFLSLSGDFLINHGDSYVDLPDPALGVLELTTGGVSTSSFSLEISAVGTHGQSGVTFSLTVTADLELITGGQSDVTSLKDPPDLNLETGVFLELTTGGVSAVQAALLDVILTPFPRVLPVSMSGRARWCQYRFDVDGAVDVLIAGFVLYVVSSGQLNVDEP